MKRVMLVVLLFVVLFPQPLTLAQSPDTGPYQEVRTIGRGFVRSAAWSPDGNLIAVGGALGIWLYTPDLQDVGLMKGHAKAVYGLAFSPDSKRIASASHDKTVRVWDVESQTERLKLEGHSGLVVTVAWSPDGEILASGGYDGTVRLWDAESGEALSVIEGDMGDVQLVSWGLDGSILAAANRHGQIFIWDVEKKRLLSTLASSNQIPLWFLWDQDGNIMVFWNNRDVGVVEIWNAIAGTLQHSQPSVTADAMAWAPERIGKVVFADWNSTFQLWDVATNTLLGQRPEHMDWIVWLSWDHDVIRAATEDERLLGWDANTGEVLSVDTTSLDGLPTNLSSPDGTKRAEVNEGGVVRIFDAATDEQIAEFPGLANTVAWNADSKQIAVAMRNGTIKVWGEDDDS